VTRNSGRKYKKTENIKIKKKHLEKETPVREEDGRRDDVEVTRAEGEEVVED